MQQKVSHKCWKKLGKKNEWDQKEANKRTIYSTDICIKLKKKEYEKEQKIQ